MSDVAAILWRKQITSPLCTRPTYVVDLFYSNSNISFKQQFVDRHVAPLGYIILRGGFRGGRAGRATP